MVITATLNRFRKLSLACMLALLCCWSNKASATHVAAADLYADYVGTSATDLRYVMTLVLYKACEPNNSDLDTFPKQINFQSSCQTFTWNLPRLAGPDTLDQLCPNFAPVNACRVSGAVWPAFVRIMYRDTVTFPVACVDWTFSYSLCCRNGGILNLSNPLNYSLYIEGGMNNVFRVNNNTPRFTVDPIPYICQNQQSYFLNGPFDPDNDSVITTNVQPLDAANAPIGYSGTYSLNDPVGSTNGYIVDPNTGTAGFIPPLQGKFVIAFVATDYDRATGTPLSFIRRDVQVSVLNCAADPPGIDSIPMTLTGGALVSNNGPKYIVACPEVPLTFDVHSNSNTISNSVYLVCNNNLVIPASTFTVANNGSSAPVGTFSWLPTTADIGDYTIIVTAKDSTCNNNQPIVLKSYLVIFIKVGAGIAAGPDGRVCQFGGDPWELTVSGPPGTQYKWSALDGSAALGLLDDDTSSHPRARPPYNFEYLVTGVNLFCNNKDTVLVWVDTTNSVVVTPHNAVQCRPGYFQLLAEGLGLAPLANLQCGIIDTIGCIKQDTFAVNTIDNAGPPSQTSTYSPFLGYRTARIQFLIPNKDLRAYGIRSGTIKGLAFDVKSLPSPPSSIQYQSFSISLKCTDRTDISAASGGLEVGATLVYTSPGSLIVGATGWRQFDFDRPYSLDSSKGLVVEICYNNTFTQNPASLQVNSVPTSREQMVVTYGLQGISSMCAPTPPPTLGTVYYKARPTMRFNMCTAGTIPFSFTWWPGTFLSDSTIANPLAYINKDSWFHVSTVGRNGCTVMDSGFVKVPVHHYDIWPKDTTFCYGQSFKMISMGDFDKVKWMEVQTDGSFSTVNDVDCDDCREPIATPLEDTKYAAIMTDIDGCSDTMTLTARVKPLPLVHIINNDTTIKYGQSIQLYVSGAYLYSWQPISSLTNPNISNPYATPTEPTKYYVQGLGENGCRNIDSVTIKIDYRDNLFVPSAFTPNGDGSNDVFRVVNITFQKLQEFRIFNRWGQEIYSTTDPKKGWDGSWKGVPQDIGSYQYLIKVAYPDGYIETYKGDVTLVR